jgi:hypothetical protein
MRLVNFVTAEMSEIEFFDKISTVTDVGMLSKPDEIRLCGISKVNRLENGADGADVGGILVVGETELVPTDVAPVVTAGVGLDEVADWLVLVGVESGFVVVTVRPPSVVPPKFKLVLLKSQSNEVKLLKSAFNS